MTFAIERAIEAIEELKTLDKDIDYAKPKGQAFNQLPRAIHMVTLAAGGLKQEKINDKPVRYVVNGRGGFPMDMLRHDRSYPVDGDYMHIARSDGTKNVYSVTLVAQNRRSITPARWSSFGWTVTEIEGE